MSCVFVLPFSHGPIARSARLSSGRSATRAARLVRLDSVGPLLFHFSGGTGRLSFLSVVAASCRVVYSRPLFLCVPIGTRPGPGRKKGMSW